VFWKCRFPLCFIYVTELTDPFPLNLFGIWAIGLWVFTHRRYTDDNLFQFTSHFSHTSSVILQISCLGGVCGCLSLNPLECIEHKTNLSSLAQDLDTLYTSGSQSLLRGSQRDPWPFLEDPWIRLCNGYFGIYSF